MSTGVQCICGPRAWRRRALAALSAGLLAGAPAAASPVAGYAPPGRMLSVGQHRLHLNCEGRGGPVVVMDAGLGGTSLDWVRVQPEVAREARVCSYDRAGYGWSELGPLPRTSERIIGELHTLLQRAGEPPPYLLVGHSFGGYNVRLFARRYPREVSGLILVDAAHEEQARRFAERGIELRTAPRSTIVSMSPPSVPTGMPAELRDMALALAGNFRARKAVHGELASFLDSAAQLARAPEPRAVPTTIITRGQRVWPRTVRGDRMERLWLELQDDLAGRRVHTPHLFARNAGHYVQLDQPLIVVRAILAMLASARR